MPAADPLSTVFAALADPTRRRMLARLTDGPMTVARLSEPFNLSPPGISKHLKVLENAGLIERTRNAQYRPCKLRAKPLADLADWLEPYRTHRTPPRDQPQVRIPKLRVKPVNSTKPTPTRPSPATLSTGIDESHW